MTEETLTIGVVAPSAVIPQVELKLASDRLQSEGFSVRLHPQCKLQDRYFAGTDADRASAFMDYARDPSVDVVWCARGGYGAARLLPLLRQGAAKKGKPERKLLIGYSDATALMEFVRNEWGWDTLHGPMLGLKEFSILEKDEWSALMDLLKREGTGYEWSRKKLRFLANRPRKTVTAPLVGGNLTVWASLLGTPFAGRAEGSILFLEDVTEALYRLDRTAYQLSAAGVFDEVKGVILGTFENCNDSIPNVLAKPPKSDQELRGWLADSSGTSKFKPLRKKLIAKDAIEALFIELAEKHGFPLATGLPVGHGPGYPPLPLGATYRLQPTGDLVMNSWTWLDV